MIVKFFHLITQCLGKTDVADMVVEYFWPVACKHIELDTDCKLLVCEAELPNHSPLIIAVL